MNCRHAQPLLSARMDGEHLSSAQRAAVESHVANCVSCQTFEARSMRVRTAVRIRPAEPVPDLTETIMAEVARGGARPTARRSPARRGNRFVPAIAAAIAGMLVGSLLVGGPWPGNTPTASAASIARAIREAAPSVNAFQGSYLIQERGLDPAVPDRTLQMDVAFLAPQRFRLDVRDLTSYPSPAWTPTDLTYIEDMPATYRSGPTGCPATLPPADCPPTRTVVSRASAYSAAAPLSADLIAPIATFGSTDGVVVLGQEDVDGHTTVHVEMTFARAAPLFPFLRLGGTWRPMFEGDRVSLWLDTTGWFPVRYEVYPAADPERRGWEMRFGLPRERTDTSIMEVTLGSVSQDAPDPSSFSMPGLASPHDVPLADAPRRLGYVPVVPGDTGHLDLTSLVAPTGDAPAAPSSVLVYAAGLDYLRISEDPAWAGPGPFGPVDAAAQPVALPTGGVALYEPAGDGLGRRLAIHGADTDLFLETNLTRDELLSIAATLPISARPLPAAWRIARTGSLRVEQITIEDALDDVGSPTLASELPPGYVIASATRTFDGGRLVGTTITLRQREIDDAGPPVTLHVAPSIDSPRTSAPDQVSVTIGDTPARWTPSGALLEWEADGQYRSLQGGVGLAVLLEIADALTRAGA